MIDKVAIDALIERATDALRPLGLTVVPGVSVQYDPQQDAMVVVFPCLIGDRALTQQESLEGAESKKKFHDMMKGNRLDAMRRQAEEIKKAYDEGRLDDLLKEDAGDCAHEIHEGLCILCHKEFGEES